MVRLPLPYGKHAMAIAMGNECELAAHSGITERLAIKGGNKVGVCFSGQYSAWQKEAIENANKLIRLFGSAHERFVQDIMEF